MLGKVHLGQGMRVAVDEGSAPIGVGDVATSRRGSVIYGGLLPVDSSGLMVVAVPALAIRRAVRLRRYQSAGCIRGTGLA